MKLWFSDISDKLEKYGKSLPKNISIKLPPNVSMQSVTNLLQQIVQILKNPPSSDTANGPPRHMKYPYTFSAKLAQFPYKFYYNNNWIFKYNIYGFLTCLPIFWYISSLANSKENKAKWKEIRRKEHEEFKHKFD